MEDERFDKLPKRRRRDSNSREDCSSTSFPTKRTRPLCDISTLIILYLFFSNVGHRQFSTENFRNPVSQPGCSDFEMFQVFTFQHHSTMRIFQQEIQYPIWNLESKLTSNSINKINEFLFLFWF